MSEDLFTEKERVELIFGTAERLYTAHLSNGAPGIDLANAVWMAAILLALAMLEEMKTVMNKALSDPLKYRNLISEFTREVFEKISSLQEERALRIAGVLGKRD